MSQERSFRVHARHIDHHHAHLVHEVSFEAASVAYLEDYPAAPNEDHEVTVIVRDVSSGHEHCFRVNLDTGEPAAANESSSVPFVLRGDL